MPTLHEAGIDGVDVTQWYALFAPAGTPPPVVDRINAALNDVLSDPESVRQFAGHGVRVEPGSADHLGRLVSAELAAWRRMVRPAVTVGAGTDS